MSWDEVGYIVSSEYRKQVFQELSDGAKTPSGIAEDTGIKIPHVSRALSELRERGMVELLVPETTKKGRIYAISDEGDEALEAMKKESLVA